MRTGSPRQCFSDTPRKRFRKARYAALFCVQAAVASGEERLPDDFVDAASIVPGLVADIRYAGVHNFTGERVDGYLAPRCLLTRKAADALRAVQADLQTSGLGLKVFDCYRPVRAVAHFVRWANGAGSDVGRAEFYPNVARRTLFAAGYIGARSAHSRGSTVDLTLVERGGAERDMGTAFDFFGPESGCCSGRIAAAASANRRRLQAAMTKQGFAPYAKEWWHFTLRREPYPTKAFDAPIR